MNDLPEAKWRVRPGIDLHWKTWGEDFVVFNSASGETHLLDAFSGTVLNLLETSPSTMSQLHQQLAGMLGVDANTLSERLRATCTRFLALGLAAESAT